MESIQNRMNNDILFYISRYSAVLYQRFQIASKSFYLYLKKLSPVYLTQIRRSYATMIEMAQYSLFHYVMQAPFMYEDKALMMRTTGLVLPNKQKEGLWITTNRKGVIIESTHYYIGKKHGECLKWDRKGKLFFKATYIDDKLHGLVEEYTYNYKISTTYNYGIVEGRCQRLNLIDNTLDYDYTIVNGKKDGMTVEYTRDASLLDNGRQISSCQGMGEYRDDVKVGCWSYWTRSWSRSGTIVKIETYDQDGKLIKPGKTPRKVNISIKQLRRQRQRQCKNQYRHQNRNRKCVVG